MRAAGVRDATWSPGFVRLALKTGAPVSIAGVTIGRVEDIQYDINLYKAIVTMRISDKYRAIPNDSDASIYTAGLLGAVSVTGNTVTYDPSGVWNQPGGVNPLRAGDTAEVSFKYTADDGHGGTATATVKVTIKGSMPPVPTECPPSAGGLSLLSGSLQPGETVTVSGLITGQDLVIDGGMNAI